MAIENNNEDSGKPVNEEFRNFEPSEDGAFQDGMCPCVRGATQNENNSISRKLHKLYEILETVAINFR